MRKLLQKVLGDPNEKYLKTLQPLVSQVNALEPQMQALSMEELKGKTEEFKKRLAEGKTLDDILPEAFAVVREASVRTLSKRHFDVQLIGGAVLHRGEIAEMRTGEGKTLTATLAVYLNALAGKGVHVVTVNDYLSKRDAEWMGQIYHALGLTIGVVQGQNTSFKYVEKGTETEDEIRDRGVEVEMNYLQECSRKEAYDCDITYGTNNEFGFDYLRDNMAVKADQMVQRGHAFAIVDEVDSILIDEARTPLIISAPDMESTDKYYQFAKLVKQLVADTDYNIDEKRRASTLTAAGIEKLEKALGVENIYVDESVSTVHHIEQALRAEALFKIDRDYVVKDGEVIIVDEFTGRLLPGRRYSQGLHQAIEAKENLTIQRESKTLATITFQNYFRMYDKLAGMTGTAFTEGEEFAKIYGLQVTVVPTNKAVVRDDKSDRIYRSEKGKFLAVVSEIKALHEKGQPVLVGTVSIDKNELLSQMLSREGVPHNVLNAKNHEKEASIIAQAGKPGAVTIATNMAGRGVDIVLGGNPPEHQDEVLQNGGLFVIGTERHESRRIDNQLRGRAGRQGDRGATQFYVSVEDDLMRVFGSDRMKNMMETLRMPEDQAIENKFITRALEEAQKRVESHNFDIRKHVVEYDDVLNKQREVIYQKRQEILLDSEVNPMITKERMLEMIEDEIFNVVEFHTQQDEQEWNLKEIFETMSTMFALTAAQHLSLDQIRALDPLPEDDSLKERLVQYLFDLAKVTYERVEHDVVEVVKDANVFRDIEKQLMLRSIDALWIEHLESMDNLRASIGLRGYGQRDPLVEYKREGFRLFNGLLSQIRERVVYAIFKVRAQLKEEASLLERAGMKLLAPSKSSDGTESQTASGDDKVGRNDPCPCGSGKKYKKCHGA